MIPNETSIRAEHRAAIGLGAAENEWNEVENFLAIVE